ncbi:MAG: hypothetical protein KY444_00535, partial [Gemmatimonadetes bacterium]|nr:hypothetical protein [Gemmatimonadota bacterium]
MDPPPRFHEYLAMSLHQSYRLEHVPANLGDPALMNDMGVRRPMVGGEDLDAPATLAYDDGHEYTYRLGFRSRRRSPSR